jgi:hypothetical protein
MPDFAYARMVAGKPTPGVFVVNDRLPVGQAIDELLLVDACSEQAEWAGLVSYLPALTRAPLHRGYEFRATVAGCLGRGAGVP